MTIIKKIFGEKRIIGYAGNRNCGKTNNLVALVRKFREGNKGTKIYIFGFDTETTNYLKKLGNVFVISELKHLVGKSDSVFILDEIQKLKLTDRRYKDIVDNFSDLIYHPDYNNYAILCSPNLREFNSVIGRIVDKWLVKSIRFSDLVNGSPLKEAVEQYKGRYKLLDDLIIPKDKILVLGDDYENILTLDYIKEVDTKTKTKDILSKDLNCQRESQGIVKEKVKDDHYCERHELEYDTDECPYCKQEDEIDWIYDREVGK